MALIDMEIANGEVSALTWVYGTTSSATVNLGFKPKKIIIYAIINTSQSSVSNGCGIGIYDEEVSTTQIKYKHGNTDSMVNMAASYPISEVNDNGFVIGSTIWSYSTQSSFRYWAAS